MITKAVVTGTAPGVSTEDTAPAEPEVRGQ